MPLRVTASAVTLVAFFINIFCYDLSWAAGAPSELTSVGSDRTGGTGFKELNATTFSLPEHLGRIKESCIGSGGRTIVQIQDAHCNYDAQKKVAEIIEYMRSEYGISSVNLEGGFRDYDLSIFTWIADKEARKRASEHFVKEGLVNGAEYYAVNNPEKVTLWGMEDPALYIENLDAYKDSIAYRDSVNRSLRSLSYVLSSLKSKIYPKVLLDLDARYSAYKAGNINMKEYLLYLIDQAAARSVDMKDYRNIVLLSRVLREEGAIDFKKADKERDSLTDSLQKKLSRNAMDEFIVKTVEFKMEKISHKDYYEYLFKQADRLRLDTKDYPELVKYVAYISDYAAVDKMKITDEMDALEVNIKDSMFESGSQRELAALSKDLAIMKNIFDISLTRDDYRYYKSHEDGFAVKNFIRFIDSNAARCGIAAKLDEGISKLDGYRADITRFYELSFQRDEAFVKNMRFREGQRASIMVTGGFHTDNLCDIFRKDGVSYISIIPNFKNDAKYKSPYFDILSGAPTSTQKALQPYVSTMQVPSYLAAIKKAIPESELISGELEFYLQGMVEQGDRFLITDGSGSVIIDHSAGDSGARAITVAELISLVKGIKKRPALMKYPDTVSYAMHPWVRKESASGNIKQMADSVTGLDRHLEQKKKIRNDFISDRVNAVKSGSPRKIDILVYGASTGEDIASFYHESVAGLAAQGEDVGSWAIRIIGIEKDQKVCDEGLRRLSGESPFVRFETDDSYPKEVLASLAGLRNYGKHSLSIIHGDVTDVDGALSDGGSPQDFRPDLAVMNNVLYLLDPQRRAGVVDRVAGEWPSAWLAINGSENVVKKSIAGSQSHYKYILNNDSNTSLEIVLAPVTMAASAQEVALERVINSEGKSVGTIKFDPIRITEIIPEDKKKIDLAIKEGNLIRLELDLESMSPDERGFNKVMMVFDALSQYISQEYFRYFGTTPYDVNLVLRELLMNAFYRGNKLYLNKPIYIRFIVNNADNADKIIEAYDFAINEPLRESGKEYLKIEEAAKRAGLGGKGLGRKTSQNAGWVHGSDEGEPVMYMGEQVGKKWSVRYRPQSKPDIAVPAATPLEEEHASGVDLRSLRPVMTDKRCQVELPDGSIKEFRLSESQLKVLQALSQAAAKSGVSVSDVAFGGGFVRALWYGVYSSDLDMVLPGGNSSDILQDELQRLTGMNVDVLGHGKDLRDLAAMSDFTMNKAVLFVDKIDANKGIYSFKVARPEDADSRNMVNRAIDALERRSLALTHPTDPMNINNMRLVLRAVMFLSTIDGLENNIDPMTLRILTSIPENIYEYYHQMSQAPSDTRSGNGFHMNLSVFVAYEDYGKRLIAIGEIYGERMRHRVEYWKKCLGVKELDEFMSESQKPHAPGIVPVMLPPTYLEYEEKGFEVSDVPTKPAFGTSIKLRTDEFASIKPGEELLLNMSTCVALVAFDDSGKPLGVFHLGTAKFMESVMEHGINVLGQNNRFLIVRSPGQDSLQNDYVMRLLEYLQREAKDGGRGIALDRIFEHRSSAGPGELDRNILYGMQLRVLKDGAVSVENYQMPRGKTEIDAGDRKSGEIIRAMPIGRSASGADLSIELLRNEMVERSKAIESMRRSLLQQIFAKETEIFDEMHKTMKAVYMEKATDSDVNNVIKIIEREKGKDYAEQYRAEYGKILKAQEEFAVRIKERNESPRLIRDVADRRNAIALQTEIALRAPPTKLVNIYIANNSGNGGMGIAQLVAEALRYSNKGAKIKMYLMDGNMPAEFSGQNDPDIELIPIIGGNPSRMQIDAADLHVGVNRNVTFTKDGDALFKIDLPPSAFGRKSDSVEYYSRKSNDDLLDPFGTLQLNKGLLDSRRSRDSWTQADYEKNRGLWLSRNLSDRADLLRESGNREEGRTWSPEKAVWTCGYFQETGNLFKELDALGNMLRQKPETAGRMFIEGGKQVIIFLTPGELADGKFKDSDFTARGIRVMNADGAVSEGDAANRVPITVVLNKGLSNTAFKELQSQLKGTMVPMSDGTGWVDFPSIVTGVASFEEALSSGASFMHDGYDCGVGTKPDMVVAALVKMLALKDPGASYMDLKDEAVRLSKYFLLGVGGILKYQDMESWTRLAREFSKAMYSFNVIDDMLSELVKDQPLVRQEPAADSLHPTPVSPLASDTVAYDVAQAEKHKGINPIATDVLGLLPIRSSMTPELTGTGLAAAVEEVLMDVRAYKGKYDNYDKLLRAGAAIFDGYSEYLNDKGLELKARFDAMLDRAGKEGFDWSKEFKAFKYMVVGIPRVSRNIIDLQLDLFKDAFPGVTDEQLKSFSLVGLGTGEGLRLNNGLTLNLTKGCSNQCVTCGAMAPCGKLESMPFPVAVKILRRLSAVTDFISPYYNSEPLDYYDNRIGANIVDIVNAARGFGINNISIVTHGSNARMKEAPELVKNIMGKTGNTKVAISLHIDHADVLNYVQGIQKGMPVSMKSREGIRQKIIDRYVNKFTPLIKAALLSGEKFDIRLYNLTPEEVKMLNTDKTRQAYDALSQMQAMREDVWNIIKDKLKVPDEYIKNWPVMWIGKSVDLLNDLGVSAELIRKMQDSAEQKSGLVGNAFTPIIESSGVTGLLVAEDNSKVSRTVGAMFTDPGSQEFRSFIRFLMDDISGRNDAEAQYSGTAFEDAQFKRVVLDDVKRFLNSHGNALNNNLTIDDIRVVTGQFSHYAQCIIDNYLAKEAVEMLMKDPGAVMGDDELAYLYRELKDVPFMAQCKFNVMIISNKFKDSKGVYLDTHYNHTYGYLRNYRYEHAFVPDSNRQMMERGLYMVPASFPLKIRAFGSPSLPATGAPQKTGLQLRIEKMRKHFSEKLGKEIATVKIPGSIDQKSVGSAISGNDSPVRQKIFDAVTSGKVVELDLSALASARDADPALRGAGLYELLDRVFGNIALAFRLTLSQEGLRFDDKQYAVKDFLDTLLSNAFVHGNEMDLSIPIFVSFMPDKLNKNVYEMTVYDLAMNTVDNDKSFFENEKKIAGAISGKQQALQEIESAWGDESVGYNGYILRDIPDDEESEKILGRSMSAGPPLDYGDSPVFEPALSKPVSAVPAPDTVAYTDSMADKAGAPGEIATDAGSLTARNQSAPAIRTAKRYPIVEVVPGLNRDDSELGASINASLQSAGINADIAEQLRSGTINANKMVAFSEDDETGLQLSEIRSDFREQIVEKISNNDRNFVIFDIGIGRHPMELLFLLNAFYRELEKIESSDAWHVTAYAIDPFPAHLPLSDDMKDGHPFTKLIAPLNKPNLKVIPVLLNVLDGEGLRKVREHANASPDYVLMRHVYYMTPYYEEGEFNYETNVRNYLALKNIFAIAAPGTRLVIEPSKRILIAGEKMQEFTPGPMEAVRSIKAGAGIFDIIKPGAFPSRFVGFIDILPERMKPEALGSIAAPIPQAASSSYEGTTTNLIGKLYDNQHKLITEIDVKVQYDRIYLRGKSGDPLFDKYGNNVEFIRFVNGTSLQGRLNYERKKAEVAEQIENRLKDLEGDDLKIAQAILEYLKSCEIYYLARNDHGILGMADALGRKIFLGDTASPIGYFHEAGEAYLAENPQLVPAGLSAHSYLRGDGISARISNPRSFRVGLQDKLFGPKENNLFSASLTDLGGAQVKVKLFDDLVLKIAREGALTVSDEGALWQTDAETVRRLYEKAGNKLGDLLVPFIVTRESYIIQERVDTFAETYLEGISEQYKAGGADRNLAAKAVRGFTENYMGLLKKVAQRGVFPAGDIVKIDSLAVIGDGKGGYELKIVDAGFSYDYNSKTIDNIKRKEMALRSLMNYRDMLERLFDVEAANRFVTDSGFDFVEYTQDGVTRNYFKGVNIITYDSDHGFTKYDKLAGPEFYETWEKLLPAGSATAAPVKAEAVLRATSYMKAIKYAELLAHGKAIADTDLLELKEEISGLIRACNFDISEDPATDANGGWPVMKINPDANGRADNAISIDKLVQDIEKLIRDGGRFRAIVTKVRLLDDAGDHGVRVTTRSGYTDLTTVGNNSDILIDVIFNNTPVLSLEISNKVINKSSAAKEEAAVNPPTTGNRVDSPESRQEAFASIARMFANKDSVVKIVVGIPAGEYRNKINNMAEHIGNVLADKGYSIVSADKDRMSQAGDEEQVVTFVIEQDPQDTIRNYLAAVEKAKSEVQGGKGYVVSFAPRMEGVTLTPEQYAGVPGSVAVIPDAYSDCKDNWPDIMSRVGLARCIYMYDTNVDKDEAWKKIIELLQRISTNDLKDVSDLDSLIAQLRNIGLQIKRVNYNEEFKRWEENQRAMATSA